MNTELESKKKKKILIICIPNDHSGVPIYTKELINAFHQSAELHLLTGDTLGVFESYVNSGMVSKVKLRGLRNSFSIKLLLRFIREFRLLVRHEVYDLIHIQGTLFGFIGRAFTPAGTKILYTHHGLPFDKGINYFRRMFFSALEYYLLYTSDSDYIVLTERHKNMLLKKRKSIKVLVIPNFSRISAGDLHNKKNYSLINVAGFRPQKNHKLLFEIFSLLPNNISLICVGPGTDSIEFRRLINKYVKSSHQYRIYCLGSVENLEVQYAKSLAFIQTSNYEGLSLAAIEARACNLPLILTNTSGCDELLCDWTGLILTGRIKKDAANISSLLKNLENVDSFGSPNPEFFSRFNFRHKMSYYYE